MKIILRFIIPILSCLTLMTTPLSANTSRTEPAFSVKTLPNPYQNAGSGYSDLTLEPGAETTIALMISNDADQIATFKYQATNAFTNENIIIDYAGHPTSQQRVEGPHFTDLVSEKTGSIELAAKSNQTIYFKVKMPDVPFEGQIMGGIHINKVSDKKAPVSGAIKNEFSFSSAVILRQGDQMATTPKLKLTKAKYQVTKSGSQVQGTLVNSTQAYRSGLKIKTEILRRADQKVLFTEENVHRAIAPRTTTNTLVNLKDALPAGKYYLKYTTTTDQHETSTQAPFTVSKTDTVRSGLQIKHPLMFCLIVLGVLILGLVLLIIWLIYRQRKAKRN